MAVPSLPVELYSEIASYLFGENDELTRLALVSRTFGGVARQFLYIDIVIDRAVSPRTIGCLQTLINNPTLAKQIRELTIKDFAILPRSVTIHKFSQDVVSTSAISRLLQTMSSLRTLRFAPIISFHSDFDSEPLDYLDDSGLSPEEISSVIAHALFRPRQRAHYPNTLTHFQTNLRHPLIFDFMDEQAKLKGFIGLPDKREDVENFLPSPPSPLEQLSSLGRLDAVVIAGTTFIPLLRGILESFSKYPRNGQRFTNEVYLMLTTAYLPLDADSFLSDLDMSGVRSFCLYGAIDEMAEFILPPFSILQNGPFALSIMLDPPTLPELYAHGEENFDLSLITKHTGSFSVTVYGLIPSLSALESHFHSLVADIWTMYLFLPRSFPVLEWEREMPTDGWVVWMEPVHKEWQFDSLASYRLRGCPMITVFQKRFLNTDQFLGATKVGSLGEFFSRWKCNGSNPLNWKAE